MLSRAKGLLSIEREPFWSKWWLVVSTSDKTWALSKAGTISYLPNVEFYCSIEVSRIRQYERAGPP